MIQRQQSNGNFSDLEKDLNLKELELKALLEVTEAINANLPEDSLYKIFHFTLLSNLQIRTLALCVKDESWICKVKHGCGPINPSVFEEEVLKISKIEDASGYPGLEEYDVVIPISHKKRLLAFVLLGGVSDLPFETRSSLLSFVQTLTSILIVAIENKKLARRELQQEALRRELEIASKVQQNLFPKLLPDSDELRIKASYFPHQSVGGDYYDFVRVSEDKFLICIADVSGKGIPAALLMSNFQASLQVLVRQTRDLNYIVRELNYLVKQNSGGDRFITFFAALYDLTDRTLRYINAGHNPPLFVSGGQTILLEKGTTVLGAFDDLPFVNEGEHPLTGNDMLFAYTDGLTEVTNEADDEFGVENLKSFLTHAPLDLAEMHKSLINRLNDFRGSRNFPDDITFLSCQTN